MWTRPSESLKTQSRYAQFGIIVGKDHGVLVIRREVGGFNHFTFTNIPGIQSESVPRLVDLVTDLYWLNVSFSGSYLNVALFFVQALFVQALVTVKLS